MRRLPRSGEEQIAPGAVVGVHLAALDLGAVARPFGVEQDVG